MSRTIRRKNALSARSYYVDYNCIVDEGVVKVPCCGQLYPPYRAFERVAKTCEELISIQIAHYQSDRDRGWNAPKSFRQFYNRVYRHKCEAIVARALRDGTEENITLDHHPRSANYNYF